MKAKRQSWRSMSGYEIRDRARLYVEDHICKEDLQGMLIQNNGRCIPWQSIMLGHILLHVTLK